MKIKSLFTILGAVLLAGQVFAQDSFVSSGGFSLSPEIRELGEKGSINYKKNDTSNPLGGVVGDIAGEIKNNVPGWGDPLVDKAAGAVDQVLANTEREFSSWLQSTGWGVATPPFVPESGQKPTSGSSTSTQASTSQPQTGFRTDPYLAAEKVHQQLAERSRRAVENEINSPAPVIGVSSRSQQSSLERILP